MPRRSTRNTRETERYEPETFAIRKNLSEKKKQQIRMKSKNKCVNCGKRVLSSNSHIDHIEPFAINGDETDSNLQCLCRDCHENKTGNTHERNHINNCRKFPTIRFFEEDGVIKMRNYHCAIYNNPHLIKTRKELCNELGMELDDASMFWFWDYPVKKKSMEYLSINAFNYIIKNNNKHYIVIQAQCVKYFAEIFVDKKINQYYIPIYKNTFAGLYDRGYIEGQLPVINVKSLLNSNFVLNEIYN